MPTILEENQKPLRKAMDVMVYAQESVEVAEYKRTEPQKWITPTIKAKDAIGYDDYNCKLAEPGTSPILMDLRTGGFYNDGQAKPLLTGDSHLPAGQKYGIITQNTFEGGWELLSILFTIPEEHEDIWNEATVVLRSQWGDLYTHVLKIHEWSGATKYVDISFAHKGRVQIQSLSLGHGWQFDNSNLIDFQVQMRGANEKLDTGEFSLEGSEMSLTAYMGDDADNYIEIFSRMQKNSPITWTSGYLYDMADIRTFYLTDSDYDTKTKCLKLKGCDATLSKLDGEYPGKYIESTYAAVRQSYYNEIKRVLTSSGITPTESGTVPSGSGTNASNYFLEKSTNRKLIAKSVNLFNDNVFQLMYRDAGIPELISGEVTTVWDMKESDTVDFTTNIEKLVNEYDITLYSSTKSASNVEVATVSEAVSGQTYWIDTQEPVYSVATSGATLISPYRIKYVANTSGNVSIQGKFIKNSASVADTDKQIIKSGKRGMAVELDTLPRIDYNGGSLTEHGIETMLDTPNLTYTFKWRGNPKMKPLDLIRMERMRTVGETTIMRITSISLEYKNGGLISEITARKVGVL